MVKTELEIENLDLSNKDLIIEKIRKEIDIDIDDIYKYFTVNYYDNYNNRNNTIEICIDEFLRTDDIKYPLSDRLLVYINQVEEDFCKKAQDLIDSVFHELAFFIAQDIKSSPYEEFASKKILERIIAAPDEFYFDSSGKEDLSFRYNSKDSLCSLYCNPTESELIACGLDESIIKKLKYEATYYKIISKRDEIDKAIALVSKYEKRTERARKNYQKALDSLSDEEKIYLQLKGIL